MVICHTEPFIHIAIYVQMFCWSVMNHKIQVALLYNGISLMILSSYKQNKNLWFNNNAELWCNKRIYLYATNKKQCKSSFTLFMVHSDIENNSWRKNKECSWALNPLILPLHNTINVSIIIFCRFIHEFKFKYYVKFA